jgi:dUTP pyrophosphatase
MRKFEKITFVQFEKDFSGEFPGTSSKEISSLYEKIKLPEAATNNSVGYDFFAYFDFKLKPGEEIKVPTGIKVNLDQSLILMTVDREGISLPLAVNEWLGIYPRSGTGFKYLRVANTVGVIDSDYYDNESNEGHIWVKIRNESHDKELAFKTGDGFCQGIISLALCTTYDSRLDKKRQGGMGSTNA